MVEKIKKNEGYSKKLGLSSIFVFWCRKMPRRSVRRIIEEEHSSSSGEEEVDSSGDEIPEEIVEVEENETESFGEYFDDEV